MRDDTVGFVADIIEMRGFDEDEYKDARIGGKNGNQRNSKKFL